MRLAEITSDLNTDTEENTKKSRKIRCRRISSSDSEVEGPSLSLTINSPPKLVKYNYYQRNQNDEASNVTLNTTPDWNKNRDGRFSEGDFY